MVDRTRRARILDSAGRRFASHGVAGTTVRQIAGDIGLLSGSLYYYFPSKEAIASEIVSGFLDALVDAYADVEATPDQDSAGRLAELVRTSLRVAGAHPWACEIYQNERPDFPGFPAPEALLSKRDQAQATWRRIIEGGVRDGAFRTDVDPDRFRHMLSEIVWLTVRWYRPQLEENHDELAREVISVFFRGYTRPAARARDDASSGDALSR